MRLLVLSLMASFGVVAACGGDDGGSGTPGGDGTPGEGIEGPQGPEGPPGPVDPTEPAAPTNLIMRSTSEGPPEFTLAWDEAAGDLPIQSFIVYESGDIVAVEPGAARSTTVTLATGSGVRRFAVSAVSFTGVESPLSAEYVVDTTPRVIYSADSAFDQRLDLFSVVPANGSTPTNLTNLSASASLKRSAISPDARQVAFVADLDTDEVDELYVMPIDGSAAPLVLNGPLVSGGSLPGIFQSAPMRWSPDGTRLAFIAAKDTAGLFELYVTPADGSSAPLKVSGVITDLGIDLNAFPSAFEWSPDGRSIAFLAHAAPAEINLYVTPADGSAAPINVSADIGTNFFIMSPLWSPDGERLAMRTNLDVYVAPADGSAEPIVVTGTPVGASISGTVSWSPDSTRIAFISDRRMSGVFEPFVNTVLGDSEPLALVGAMVATSDASQLAWSPNSELLAFTDDLNTNDIKELFVAPAAGGGATRVSGSLVATGQTWDFAWAPDSSRLAFRADRITAGKVELWTTKPDGTGLTAVSGNFPAAQQVMPYMKWSPDAQRLAFVGDIGTAGVAEVFVTTATAGAEPIPVSGLMPAAADAATTHLAWSPLASQ